MNSFARFVAGALAPTLLAFFLVACEDGGGTTVYTTGRSDSAATLGEELSHKDDTTGSWSGTALTNKVSASLSLSEHSSSVTGSFHSGARSHSVSGTHDGYTVRLELSNGDSWALAYGGSTLSGHGQTRDGYQYSVFFERK